jgi:signal transduction histidine kinase/CheY-like chemotaxis protein
MVDSWLSGRTRSSLFIVGVSLVPVVMVVLMVTFLLHQSTGRAVERRIEGFVHGVQTALDGRLNYGLRLAVALAQSYSLQFRRYDEFANEAYAIVEKDADLAWIVVTDLPAEKFVFHTGRPETPAQAIPAGPNAMAQGKVVLASQKPTIFGVRTHGPNISEATVPIRTPISSAPEAGLTLTVMLRAKAMDTLFQGIPQTWGIAIIDGNGTVATSNQHLLFPAGKSARPETLARLANTCRPDHQHGHTALGHHLHQIFEGVQYDRSEFVELVSCSQETGWSVVFSVPANEIHAPFRESLPLILAAGLLAMALSVGIARYFGKRLQETQALREARDAAEVANRLKNEFLANMSHELRTPLNAILGHAQLMASEAERTSNRSSEGLTQAHIEQISRSGWHLLELIEQILDFSKIEADMVEINKVPTELSSLISDCVAQLKPNADKKQVSLQVEILGIEQHWVQADPLRVRQILLNLVSNAIKYNNSGGSVRIILTDSERNKVRISVQDTGRGMTPQQLQQLFQPFVRFVRRGEVIEGTGIGLAISRRLTESMGSKLSVSSKPDVGSEFSFELNRCEAPQADEPGQMALLERSDPVQASDATEVPHLIPHRPIKLLYVEDTLTNFEIVRLFLEKEFPLQLIHAADGESGLEIALREQPDLILMDMNLPGLNGIEVKHALSNSPTTAGIPVIALSANAMQVDIDRAHDAGFSGYLTKPFKLPELRETLRSFVSRILEKESFKA